jgi:hypothetical protein
MKVNTDAEGNNLGNDWSTAGKFKDEFRKFINAELAALESKPATDAKADIERRRQEEFENLFTYEQRLGNYKRQDGINIILVTKNGVGEWTAGTKIPKTDEKGNILQDAVGQLVEYRYEDKFERFGKGEEGKLKAIRHGLDLVDNKINARYDAELAALESGKQQTTDANVIAASSNEGKIKLNLATSIINKQLVKQDLEDELENIGFKSRSIADLEQLSKKYNILFSIKNSEIQTKEGNKKIDDFLDKVNKAAEDEYQELIDNSVVDFTTIGKTNFIIHTDLLNVSSSDVALALSKKGINYVKVIEVTSPYSGVIEVTSEGETITANVNFNRLHEISKIRSILNKEINEKGLSIKGLSRDINFKKAVARKYSIEEAGQEAEELENELKTKLNKIQELSDNFNEALYQSIGVVPDNLLETVTYKPSISSTLKSGQTNEVTLKKPPTPSSFKFNIQESPHINQKEYTPF